MFIYNIDNNKIIKTDIWVPNNDIGYIGHFLYHNQTKEICYVLPYIEEKILCICKIASGTETQSIIDYSNLCKIKDYFCPSKLLIMHNHPDNKYLYPSLQDREMNRHCLIYCNDILQIELKDNLIFTPNGKYISFMNEEEWEYAG